MEPRKQTEADEETLYQEKLNKSFEEDFSVEIAEQADRIADAKTEHLEIVLEEQSEDDLFLKAELENEAKQHHDS